MDRATKQLLKLLFKKREIKNLDNHLSKECWHIISKSFKTPKKHIDGSLMHIEYIQENINSFFSPKNNWAIIEYKDYYWWTQNKELIEMYIKQTEVEIESRIKKLIELKYVLKH